MRTDTFDGVFISGLFSNAYYSYSYSYRYQYLSISLDQTKELTRQNISVSEFMFDQTTENFD